MTTARVRLWLAKIDESDPQDLKWAFRPSGLHSVLVIEEAAGSVPTLATGSFWRDRTLQRDYSMYDDLTFQSEPVDDQPWNVVRASDRLTSGRFRVSVDEYPVSGEDARGSELRFHDAPLLQCYTDRGLELLIPCYEIFRRFYALTSDLANALLAGHWKRELATLVDIELTRVSEDGKSFEVAPLVAMRDIGCLGIALFLTMPVAGRRASEIFPAIENLRRRGIRDPWIFARPPWQQPMALTFIGQRLRSGAVLVKWIYDSPFPSIPYPVVRMDPSVNIPVESESEPVRPPGVPMADRIAELSDATIQPAADARVSRAAVHFGLGDFWTKLVKVKHRARKKIYVPFNPVTEGDSPPPRKRRLTTGRRSETGRAPTASWSSDSQNVIMNRFNALAECFEELLQAGEIRAREDYAPCNPVQIGLHLYCAFPMAIGGVARPWTIVNPEEPRPRLCWVSEITASDGSLYYWFEVEALSREAFKALVVKPRTPGARLTSDTLEVILKIGATSKGQWKRGALLTVEEHVKWLSARHSFSSGRLRSSVVLGKLRSLR